MGLPNTKNRREWEEKKEQIIWDIVKDTSDVISKVTGVPFYSTWKSLELTGKATGIIPKKEDTKKRKRNIF